MLVDNIGELVTNDPAWGGLLGIVQDAAVAIDGDRIAWVGPSGNAPEGVDGPRVDAAGAALVSPRATIARAASTSTSPFWPRTFFQIT